MATWQEGNGGNFLAGIGGQNTNAPQSGDNRLALGLIRENNDFARAGGNNIGLQALQGLSGIAGMYQKEQQQNAINAFNDAHAQAWKSGDTSILRDFAAANPAFVSQAQQAVSGLDDHQKAEMGKLATGVNTALSQGPEAFSKFVTDNSDSLKRIGADPNWMIQAGVQNPEQLSHFATTLALGSVGPEKAFDVTDKMAGRDIDRGRLAETIRSNKAGEGLQARGQNITMRGQDISSATARRGQDMANQRAGAAGGQGDRVVQLADGRTVNVGGKLHGAGANAFYEGIDNAGNMVRVPASSIAAPATSAASAQNYAMKKDLDAISGASADDLGFMTGVTGSSGSPALGADIRSRASGGDQRKLYNAAQRIQGKMQNQGIAAARDMGASGINTVAEAKMYFQGMPQVDYSSPEAMQQSMRDIQQYTDNYNQQYQVDVGNGGRRQQQPSAPQTTQPKTSGYQSLWGD
ncbi:phage DNA ejection protein [Salmonella enterica]|uniref:phage DNA ejection protein n=1 Tax=Salmonella enterica TaxID=28901 RepID=UPI000F99C9B5|nr:phage DNA ejection protein [Salmonella enterica]EEC0786865.1 DNA transfer protein [Salmonella enterica subsp. enterica]EEJ7600381.1 DNA transfer protein [Salmonella enterica subsp. enterica serovar Kiambu]EAO7509474.1 DNA transfer protein [Salmonella enterica]EAS1993784.1 DNA transfer protein [Salmonella enterica]EAX6329063.1 DNA transfer protein [Salmonella enterica]